MSRHPILLRALGHPLVLFSILLLVVNDHLLKAVCPSWLTGKLSDFAGLFFFPFVLGVVIEGLSVRLRQFSPRRALLTAIALTGLGFTLVKTQPEANRLAEDLLAHLTGLPGQIVIDPSDLIALVIFIPAWNLWRSIEQQPQQSAPNRWSYLALAAASLAALASDCPPPYGVSHVVEHNEVLYAGGYYKASGYRGVVYASQDEGQTWEIRDELPEGIQAALDEDNVYPRQICDPDQPALCYRITGQPEIELSTDGGQTWQVAWQTPEGRFDFMQRSRNSTCDQIPDSHPFDLMMTSGPDQPVLIASMGNEGILRYVEGGEWERAAVGQAGPSPYAARTVQEAFEMTTEFYFGLAAGFLVLFLLSPVSWWRLLKVRKENLPPDRNAAWALRNLWFILLIFLLAFASLFLFSILPYILGITFLAAAPLFTIGIFIGTWNNVYEITGIPERVARMIGIVILTGVAVFFVSWPPALLWALWIIPRYSTALAISLTLVGIALCAGVWAIVREGQKLVIDSGEDEGNTP